jgi:CHASE3 domain sensor protein
VAFSLAAGTAFFSVFSIREVSAAGADVARIQSTLLGINQLLAALINAETGQRGFLLTGNGEYLAPHENAVRQIPALMNRVRSGLADSPEHTAAYAEVEKLVGAKLAEMEHSLTVKQSDGREAAIKLVTTDAGLHTMESIRLLMEKIEHRELELLAARTEIVRQRTSRFQFISFTMLGVAVIMTIIGFRLFIRRVNELETMITVCAWTKRVKDNGEWISFEDYLHDRFKLEFTHSISEDAAKKLMLEELELHPEPRGNSPKR